MEILAHRGSIDEGINENTLPAFERAKKLGANGIETDVRMTKDKELVLFHDNSIGRRSIRKLTKKQIESRVGYKLDTVNDVLNWADNDFMLNFEIKEHDIVGEMYEELKKFKRKNMLVSSFHHPTSFKLSKVTSARCGLLMPVRPIFIKPFMQLIPAHLEYVIWDYDVYDNEFRAELINYKHIVYNMGEMVPVKKDFVDGIISDHLDIHVKS